ncbi:bifunctional UDP-sugar hydrolase/5'-nucleotidase [Sphingobacterium spiritivorum]|uniref:5'-nucleotidase n=1 Tax=Sphingobacterium spiritivorum TaxID=258 RepID=UPI00191A0ECB|nr:5'-nucleotidase [Sphingobacterium spiritivorum]QQS96421.1 5'-nucleotidase [Sphingobacterium spiritivorum]
MTNQRRSFLKRSSVLLSSILLARPLAGAAQSSKKISSLADNKRLIIYQTNDLSSINYWSRYNEILRTLEAEPTSGLILDAGNLFDASADVFQNKERIAKLNKIGFHAAACSDIYLNKGEEGLADLLPAINFPLISSNYQFSDARLQKGILPYMIIHSKGQKIGIIAVAQNTEMPDVSVQHPYKSAEKISKLLKDQENCKLVICLSQLGMDRKQWNSYDLAQETSYIDLILSNSVGNKVNGTLILRNKAKNEVILSQALDSGQLLSKNILGYDDDNNRQSYNHEYLMPANHYASNKEIYKELFSVKQQQA